MQTTQLPAQLAQQSVGSQLPTKILTSTPNTVLSQTSNSSILSNNSTTLSNTLTPTPQNADSLSQLNIAELAASQAGITSQDISPQATPDSTTFPSADMFSSEKVDSSRTPTPIRIPTPAHTPTLLQMSGATTPTHNISHPPTPTQTPTPSVTPTSQGIVPQNFIQLSRKFARGQSVNSSLQQLISANTSGAMNILPTTTTSGGVNTSSQLGYTPQGAATIGNTVTAPPNINIQNVQPNVVVTNDINSVQDGKPQTIQLSAANQNTLQRIQQQIKILMLLPNRTEKQQQTLQQLAEVQQKLLMQGRIQALQSQLAANTKSTASSMTTMTPSTNTGIISPINNATNNTTNKSTNLTTPLPVISATTKTGEYYYIHALWHRLTSSVQ